MKKETSTQQEAQAKKSTLGKQKITVLRVFEILNSIELCSAIEGSFGFSYALGRNKKILMEQAKDIENMNKADEDYEKYQRERQELVEKLAKKNGDQIEYTDSQTPGLTGKVPVYKNPETAEKQLNELAKKHAAAIDKRKKKNREYVEFVNSESIEIELYKIKKEHLPEERLTPAMVYGILELIEDFE
jgi:hypothetical protein